MKLSKFDPWRIANRPEGHAYRAYPAYPLSSLSTLGTIGIGADPHSDRSPAFSDVVERWRMLLGSVQPGDALRRTLVQVATRFCAGPWAHRLTAFGWDEHAIFGVDLSHPNAGGLVQRTMSGHLLAVTPETAAIQSDGEGRVLFTQTLVAELPLLWEVCDE